MRKLYLTSANLTRLSDLLTKPISESKVIVIPTAADPYNDKWFVHEDFNQLKSMGFQVGELDLREKTMNDLKQSFADIDVIHIAGGNSFYLLEQIRKSGFDMIIDELLDNGIIYSGASAGAVVAGSSIEPVKPLDDPKIAKELTSYEGLALVNFVIIPHYGEPKYKKYMDEIISVYGNGKDQIMTLTNNQAIIVNDSFCSVISTS